MSLHLNVHLDILTKNGQISHRYLKLDTICLKVQFSHANKYQYIFTHVIYRVYVIKKAKYCL